MEIRFSILLLVNYGNFSVLAMSSILSWLPVSAGRTLCISYMVRHIKNMVRHINVRSKAHITW